METLEDTFLEIVGELDAPIACTGQYHGTGEYGHDDGPAAFLQVCRCGLDYYRCAGSVHFLSADPEPRRCSKCGTVGMYREVHRIIPLDTGL